VRIPKVKKRRLYDRRTFGSHYMESDRDFLQNNMAACLWFLENREKLVLLTKKASK
jgi:hypothetical protein